MVETSLPIYVSEVCYNAGIEPTLQPITDERLCHSTADTEDGGHVDIKAQGFWGSDRQSAFFDVWVFNPLTQTYHSLRLATCHRRHKQEKKMAYLMSGSGKSNIVVSHPLSFQYLHGGMGPTIYKKLMSMIATKHNQPYSQSDQLAVLQAQFPCFAPPSCA